MDSPSPGFIFRESRSVTGACYHFSIGGACSIGAMLPCKQREAGASPVASTNLTQIKSTFNFGGLASSDDSVVRQRKGDFARSFRLEPSGSGTARQTQSCKFRSLASCGTMLEDGRCFCCRWQMLKQQAVLASRRISTQTSTVKDEGQLSCARPFCRQEQLRSRSMTGSDPEVA
jgi:hypothetical protein